MRQRHFSVLIALALAGLAGAVPAAPATAPALAAAAPAAPAAAPAAPAALASPAEFFDLGRLWTFHIHVSNEAWKTMQPSRISGINRFFGIPQRPATRPADRKVDEDDVRVSPFGLEYTYVSGSIDFLGKTYSNVALRFKGNASYTSTESTLKHPFKVNFNRDVPGQKFLGMGNLNFHNNSFDPSQMREALSYYAFREAGVAAPRTAFALLYLTVDGLYDHVCLGLYTVTEQVDKEFLKEHFASGKGLLLKPEGVRDLPYMGDDWANYKDRYRPRTDPTPETTRGLVELLRLVHEADDATFRAQIAAHLDVDNFLRFLAVNALLCNYDSFLVGGHNFYLYIHPKNGRAYMMPWDMHLSLGSFGPLTPEQQPEASIAHPHVGTNAMIDRILAIDEYNQLYRRHLQHLIATAYAPFRLQAQIDKMQRVIDEADRLYRQSSGSPTTMPAPRRLRNAPNLRDFVVQRVESVAAQLAGKGEGVIPAIRGGPNAAPMRPLHAVSIAGDLLRWAGTGPNARASREQILAASTSFFKNADKTHRGWLTETNIAEVISPFLPPPPQRQARGLLQAFMGQPQGPAFVLARALMKATDASNDSRLTLDELREGVKAAFAEADKNGDGWIDEKEMVGAMAARLPAPFNAVPAPGAAPGGPGAAPDIRRVRRP